MAMRFATGRAGRVIAGRGINEHPNPGAIPNIHCINAAGPDLQRMEFPEQQQP